MAIPCPFPGAIVKVLLGGIKVFNNVLGNPGDTLPFFLFRIQQRQYPPVFLPGEFAIKVVEESAHDFSSLNDPFGKFFRGKLSQGGFEIVFVGHNHDFPEHIPVMSKGFGIESVPYTNADLIHLED
jgi:hypothetical protein